MTEKANEIYRRMYSIVYTAIKKQLELQKQSKHPISMTTQLVDAILKAVSEEIANVK